MRGLTRLAGRVSRMGEPCAQLPERPTWFAGNEGLSGHQFVMEAASIPVALAGHGGCPPLLLSSREGAV